VALERECQAEIHRVEVQIATSTPLISVVLPFGIHSAQQIYRIHQQKRSIHSSIHSFVFIQIFNGTTMLMRAFSTARCSMYLRSRYSQSMDSLFFCMCSTTTRCPYRTAGTKRASLGQQMPVCCYKITNF
jgi:hypothetical protein